ncbi:MAG: chromosomal replication initiator protein DnaA [Chlamydiae bacterium RIFCSPLOWO2_12_FULL_49_12]|nr:MAG: chromosomal replication initiator protein DnaA [Chlamydiae bacterium RIFCSPHIGHO2_12_FULL_49_32]OGN67644.1 MAG: chromosomal replication initiator protein DnaA [Chlamydiae bacterium RIFCSPLOWO2_02_FULL_49_12]OGN70968.1 MAG: chromosomal replication initiator protein DnaA [Chlamydiae bacterium RIFCSPLOWO2_12_FULL_49_12]
MLTQDLKEAWFQFLDFVQDKCSATEFENWFAPIKVLEGTSGELTLQVPNIFVQQYLIDNYRKDLRSFLPERSDGSLSLRFSIADEPPPNPPALPQSSLPQTPSLNDGVKLNHAYTFPHFIEGPANQFVKSAALGVAMRPGKSYNPLFIHGGVGLGKTHLLHAIGHYVMEHHKKLKIQYISTEGFINDLVSSLRNKSSAKLKQFYRCLDVLLIDDIQFLQNRLNFEEEFCHTFEALIQQSKQVIVTSDKPPGQLKLSERMIARMEWGLVAHIDIPDFETRVAILQHKASLKGIRLPHKVAYFIAEHIFNNVRQLEGALNRLSAYCQLMGKEISDEVMASSLGEWVQTRPSKRISVEAILKSVATLFEVKESDLRSPKRTKKIAFPRQVAMYLAKELVSDSLMKIAQSFGGKTHSTLLHSWKKIAHQVEKDEKLKRQIEMARRDIEK